MQSSPVDLGHPHRASSPPEQRGHLGHGVDLAEEVELGPQALGELAEHLAGPHALAERRPALGEVGEQRERGQVALDDRRSMPGRWTLTTTASPVWRRAR